MSGASDKNNDMQDPGPATWNEVLRVCGSFNLRKASRVVTQIYDEELSPVGLRSTQVVVLIALACDEKGMGISALSEKLLLDPSTLTRNLRPLEREGLVSIRAAKPRGKSVALTESGRERLLAAVPYWQRAQTRFIAGLGGAEWEDLLERLDQTVSAARNAAE